MSTSEYAGGFFQVDEDALVALVALLRVGSPLAKSHLQRLFLNLCQHNETMRRALGIVMCLLRAPLSSDEASAAAAAEPSAAAQAAAAGSSAQAEEPPTSLEAALQVGLKFDCCDSASGIWPCAGGTYV